MGLEDREQKGKESGNVRWTRKYMRGDREVASKRSWVWGRSGRGQGGGKVGDGVCRERSVI